ncbi:KinB-signaling pathway activation protein [Bacillus coahuilensis m2-6]|uniref:KinB-signaling pathway activation protein n=1 Tax=Bacillus coahuilensis p1.1.43 TaxID=1150625 RepID=A0A147K568_9BACI|nr:KinB-signaling pathway activation protein [Bacillus coahuilensis m2-6]KUP04752.1 KinB-signaling pathway activation protein [Bacillus coahuilensis p1.1.43]
MIVTLRSWSKFFLATLLVGGIITMVGSFLLRWDELAPYIAEQQWKQALGFAIFHLGVGFTFSVISQMGFFSYLFIHQFGLGLFRSLSLWSAVQIVIIAIVLFDLVYFRFQSFSAEGDSLGSYILLPIVVLVIGAAVSYVKTQQTKKKIFISTLFFMTVFTILEWIPVLMANNGTWLLLTLLPLVACNAYQILMLPRYNVKAK